MIQEKNQKMDSFFDDKISERLGGINFGKSTEIYKFELIKRAKAAARKSHPEMMLIDMGVGEPDWPADKEVVEALPGWLAKLKTLVCR
jgi:LL-diaminopimelate aminotransferase